MERKRGKLILAPCGAGKSTWIQKLDRNNPSSKMWLDGDMLLQKERIKNRNDYWYRLEFASQRDAINSKFKEHLDQGFNILYSGNPSHMQVDLLIIPDTKVRKQQLESRRASGGYVPSNERFELEETHYEDAAKRIAVYRGSIPSIEILEQLTSSK